jgi:hypothetical protein
MKGTITPKATRESLTSVLMPTELYTKQQVKALIDDLTRYMTQYYEHVANPSIPIQHFMEERGLL